MTDSRLRGEWLAAMRFDDLTDTAWRVFTRGLMWSNENGTDGRVPNRYLKFLHPDGEKPEAFVELVTAALWTRVPDGYQFIDWDGGLGQNTASYVAERKRKAADRQRAKREREKKGLAKQNDEADEKRAQTDSVTENVTRDVSAHVGRGRGTGRGLGQEGLADPVSAWPVAAIGEGRVAS